MAALPVLRKTADIRIGGPDAERTTPGVCNALKCIRGVEDVGIGPKLSYITVTYDANRVVPRQFETAARAMGGEVEGLAVRNSGADAGPTPSGSSSVRCSISTGIQRKD